MATIRSFFGLDPGSYVGPEIVEQLDREQCAVLLEQMLHPYGLTCPKCEASHRTGHGRTVHGVQRYVCGNCGRRYTMFSQTVWSGSKLGPRRVVLLMLLLGLEVDYRQIAQVIGVRADTVQHIATKLALYGRSEA